MEAFGLLMHGFAVLLTWKILALMMVGLVLGIFVGVLPGLGGPNGVAILLPLTFSMDPTSAIVMLSCIYWLVLVGVGMDTVSRQLRMTLGSSDLLRGINFLVAVIGLFGISEILLTMEERLALRGHAASISLRVVLKVWRDLPKYWVTLLRSSFIGCWLGITPGGAIAASFMGYNLAKRFSKDPESFGKGRIEGVFAPETAAHASGTSALLPMLALGIPGSGTAAILLGGLMVWGLNPGPLLFVEHKDFVLGLVASITTLAIALLFWPVIDKAFASMGRLWRPAKAAG